MIIPARYTEVLDNLLRNEQTVQAIAQAMSSYPLYETDPTRVKEFGTAYTVPTRQQLNDKILSYYRFREIGFETVGRFCFELETALKEIMPKYNQLFYSADQDYNPIYNVDYRKTIDRNRSDSSTGTQSSESSSTNEEYGKGVSSQTPQDSLGISNTGIDTVQYADEASWSKNSGSDSTDMSGTSTSEGEEEENTIETTKGNFGVVSAQDLVIKYRETIINIEQMIINDPRIQELFMLIY
jgi:hypothetical protein